MLTIFRTPKTGRPEDSQQDRRNAANRPHVQTPQSKQEIKRHQNTRNESMRETPQVQMATPKASGATGTTLIGKGLVFQGEVKGDGAVRVEGRLIGTVDVSSEVIIGEEGIVEGNVRSKIVSVLGKVQGNVVATDKITIDVSGSMLGDIIAPRVVVCEGAVYKGRIDMEPKADPETEKQPEKPQSEPKKETPQGKAAEKPGEKVEQNQPPKQQGGKNN